MGQGSRAGRAAGGPRGQASGLRWGDGARWWPARQAPTHNPRSPPSRSGHCSPAWAAQSPPLALGGNASGYLVKTLPDIPTLAPRKPSEPRWLVSQAGGCCPLTRLELHTGLSSWTLPGTWEGPTCNRNPSADQQEACTDHRPLWDPPAPWALLTPPKPQLTLRVPGLLCPQHPAGTAGVRWLDR